MHALFYLFIAFEVGLIAQLVKLGVALHLMAKVHYFDSSQDREWQDATMRKADRISAWPFQPDKTYSWWASV